MNNFLKPGDVITCVAPAGGVTSGTAYLIGALLVVAQTTAAAGVEFEGLRKGLVTLPKTISEGAWVAGQPVYWDATNGKTTIVPHLGLPIGVASQAALTADTTADVVLAGDSLAGRMHTVRRRFTIAEVNAGATLVPALPGIKLRMAAASAIAIGGAAGAVTTVDILGTQATVSVKLVAFAQASLTQSAELKSGGTGAAILADGASYAQNDAGAAVTVAKTGAAVTTATHVDVSFTYSLE